MFACLSPVEVSSYSFMLREVFLGCSVLDEAQKFTFSFFHAIIASVATFLGPKSGCRKYD